MIRHEERSFLSRKNYILYIYFFSLFFSFLLFFSQLGFSFFSKGPASSFSSSQQGLAHLGLWHPAAQPLSSEAVRRERCALLIRDRTTTKGRLSTSSSSSSHSRRRHRRRRLPTWLEAASPYKPPPGAARAR